MKKIIVLLAVLAAIFGCQNREKPAQPKPSVKKSPVETISKAISAPMISQTVASPQTKEGVFYVYSDHNSSVNHFIPSGWMGDYPDITLTQNWKENPYSGSTCIKITYNDKVSKGARWIGVYWQNPANNWASKEGAGFDLTEFKRLIFWARGEKGGEYIKDFRIGGIQGSFPDSDKATIGPIVLTPEWKQYSIDLTDKDLSYIIGGFGWSANVDGNPKGCIFYLDEIYYE